MTCNEKILAIKDEFYEHGTLPNTLLHIDCLRKCKQTMDRHGCDLEELIEGMKAAAIKQIKNEKFAFGVKTVF